MQAECLQASGVDMEAFFCIAQAFRVTFLKSQGFASYEYIYFILHFACGINAVDWVQASGRYGDTTTSSSYIDSADEVFGEMNFSPYKLARIYFLLSVRMH
jgi:hypothetical protein